MKILLACEIFPPDIGGPATYAHELAQWLKSHEYDVEVLCYSDEDTQYDFPVLSVSKRLPLMFRYLKYFWMLYKTSKRSDIIYAQGPIGSGVPTYLLHKIFRKKYIVKIVGDYAWESARNAHATDVGLDDFQKMKMKGKIGILQNLERRVVQNAEQIIVPSNYLKRIVSGWGVDEKKVNVVYNSFSPKNFRSTNEYNPNLIVTAGRLVPWKGFSMLIKIMPKLLEINKNFVLNIYGSGPDEEKLLNQIKDLRLEKSVFLSCQTRQDIVEKIQGALMFILNTGYEGLSHTLLECLSLGVPVITTCVGGNPEVIEDGKTGLLVDYDNEGQIIEAVRKLFAKPELRKIFFENAQKVLEKFDKEKKMAETIKIFECL